uniref:Uncharacterized protein n=1 Tax=Triticum aestivum TaxID=4565 RepID=A0A077RV17_WHEAT|nr:unnamed protein product [Triticum aestivum]
MAATLKLRILAAAAVVASSMMGVAMAAEGPAPSPDTGAAATTPAFAVGTLVAAAVGYLFC